MSRGFSQKEGEDYNFIFSPVAQYNTIYSIVSFVESQGWNLHQMDLKTTFLHGILQEEVYVEKP